LETHGLGQGINLKSYVKKFENLVPGDMIIINILDDKICFAYSCIYIRIACQEILMASIGSGPAALDTREKSVKKFRTRFSQKIITIIQSPSFGNFNNNYDCYRYNGGRMMSRVLSSSGYHSVQAQYNDHFDVV